MGAYSYPETFLSGHDRRKSAESGVGKYIEDWAMLRLVGWITAIGVVALLLWQVISADPSLPRGLSGLLLVLVTFLGGVRVGTDSCRAYMSDLERLNKVLADQNSELEKANAMLLSQLNSESPGPTENA